MSPALDPHAVIVTPRMTIRAIIAEEAAAEGATLAEVLGRARNSNVVRARKKAIRRIRLYRPEWSYPRLGALFRRDHTTIMYSLGCFDPKEEPRENADNSRCDEQPPRPGHEGTGRGVACNP